MSESRLQTEFKIGSEVLPNFISYHIQALSSQVVHRIPVGVLPVEFFYVLFHLSLALRTESLI